MFVLCIHSLVICWILFSVPSRGISLSLLDVELVSSEYEALYELYNATNGQFWELPDYWGPKWDFSSGEDPCVEQWQGVECALLNTSGAEFYHVTGLYLFHGNLHGYLPDSVGTFSELNHLDVSINSLYGTIPASIGDLSEMLELYMDDNKFSGSLPNSLGRLRKLTYMDLSQNLFNGTLPAALGNMSQLTNLVLQLNSFSGPIPSALGNLSLLTNLYMSDNVLTGTIPFTFDKLSYLETLDLATNRLDGPLPDIFGNLVNLQNLYLNGNRINGHIPDSFCNISSGLFRGIYLNDNELSGPIPACLGKISEVNYIFLQNNHLSGQLPDSLCKLTELHVLELSNNLLSGWLPDEIVGMVQLRALKLSNNAFSGPIPAALDNMTQLYQIYMFSNYLTSSIPTSLGLNAIFLDEIYLDSNYLTGTLPRFLGNGSISQFFLLTFDVHRNYLTGTIPGSLLVSLELQYVDLSTNLLSQTIPNALSINLWYIILNHNFLTGSLPRTLQNCTTLSVFNVQNNQLTGDLNGRFLPAQGSILVTLQLDNNAFSGTLPAQFFALSSLRTLTLAASCLVGTLPDTICQAVALESLILYGLHTGADCQRMPLNDAQSVSSSFGGSFPSCLLSLPALSTLILSANQLTGTIVPNATIGAYLLDLDLSHNLLSGSLPSRLQEHTWYNLDLSHNKFQGSLNAQLFQMKNVSFPNHRFEFNLTQATLANRRALSLTSNRLSGDIPSSLRSVHNISVLSGNLMACQYDKSDLPQHDHYLDEYVCASNDFNAAFYAWLGLLFLGVVALVAVGYKYQYQFQYKYFIEMQSLDLQLSCELDNKLTNVQRAMQACQLIVRCSVLSALVITTLFTPAYALIAHYAGTHEQHYAYVVSAIYASGVAPFVVNFILWVALLIAVYTTIVLIASTASLSRTKAAAAVPPHTLLTAKNRVVGYILWATYIVVNLTVVLGVNIAFVYIVLYQSSQLQTFAAILLSLFKIVWNARCAPYLLRRIVAAQAMEKGDAPSVETYFNLQLVMSLCNTIGIPCLVVAGIDPNCFSELLLDAPSKTVSYLMFVCTNFEANVGCVESTQQMATVVLTPPFTYSYQCSASFVTSYATTFIFMAISTTFVKPVLMYVLWRLHAHLQRGSRMHACVESLLPRVLRPIIGDANHKPERRWLHPVFDAKDLLVNLLTYLCILLTFGVVFTPIAAAMALSICALSYFNRFLLRRFILNVIAAPQIGYLDIVDAECAAVGSQRQLQEAVRIVVCCCCIFYTLFLFDTLGNAQGFAAAAWVLFVVPLAPFVLFGGWDVHKYSTAQTGRKERPAADKFVSDAAPMEVELTALDIEQPAMEAGKKKTGDIESTLKSEVVVKNILHTGIDTDMKL